VVETGDVILWKFRNSDVHDSPSEKQNPKVGIMSFESAAAALKVQGLKPAEKLVLIGIASHDGDGGSWPSIATLATYAGVSARQTKRLVAQLETAGYVSVTLNGGGTAKTRDDRRPNRYELTIARGDMQREQAERGDTHDTHGVTPSAPRGDMQGTDGVTPMTPELIHEPVLQLILETVPVSRCSPFDLFWAKYPRRAGKPAAAESFKAALKRATADTITDGLDRWVEHWTAERTQTFFIPHPATWLNQDRFNDIPVLTQPAASRNVRTLTNPALAAKLAAIDARNTDPKAITQ